MGRSNRAVRRDRQRSQVSKRRDGWYRDEPSNYVPLDVRSIVLPEGRCPLGGKARFATRQVAEQALREARKQRARRGSGHVETRVYECPVGGCGWHLTSRERFVPRGQADDEQ